MTRDGPYTTGAKLVGVIRTVSRLLVVSSPRQPLNYRFLFRSRTMTHLLAFPLKRAPKFSGDPFVGKQDSAPTAKPSVGLSGAMLGSASTTPHPRGSLFDDDVGLEEKDPLGDFPQPVVTSGSVGSPPQRVVSRRSRQTETMMCDAVVISRMHTQGTLDLVCSNIPVT